jgi:pyridoxine/pyridoxamine 5'-phosphate oxidase
MVAGFAGEAERQMVEQDPVNDLSPFSSPGAVQTEWSRGRAEIASAEVYWLSTVRPDGRPHVTTLLGIWLEGAFYFCTGPDERKAKNLLANRHCVVTTGNNTLEGLDIVLEGTAETTSDPAELGSVADTYESKYGAHLASPDGTWSGLGEAIRQGEALVYRVVPSKVFGFGKGTLFSQTRWGFA